MADKVRLTANIRFQLERLSTRNAHHEFEHLSRHIARARVASNILPATGPVSAGGDQGRDFETFRTYLANGPLADRSFVGLASDQVIAFACTIDKSLTSKVRADVEAICGSGQSVAAIYVFCAADMPVAKRHELIEWASKTYSVRLEIIDGNAISEMLTDGDIFWIAERYLEIPGELFPRPASKDAYEATLSKWRAIGSDWPLNYANFSELKRHARHATSKAKQDVLFWVGLLSRFLSEEGSLKRHAIYEVAVATLRGTGSMRGQEDRVREFFASMESLEPSQVEDCAALLMYCAGAVRVGAADFKLEELAAFRDALKLRAAALLAERGHASDKAMLLQQLGFTEMIPVSAHPDREQFEAALPYWSQMLDEVAQAPMFPLRRFADSLNQFIGFSDSTAKFEGLLGRVDELVAQRSGGFAAAELARDRAVSFLRKGNLVSALAHTHAAKVKWYADETIRGSVLSIMLLHHLYSQLGMNVAAKQFALGSALLAGNHDACRDLVSPALTEAAASDFKSGALVGYLKMIRAALNAYAVLSQKATDEELGSEVERTLAQLVLLRAVAMRLGGDVKALVDRKIADLPLALSNFFPDDFLAQDPHRDRTDDDMWRRCEEDLDGPPFSDLGKRRRLTFAAFGVEWRFEWDNSPEITASVEELIAALQIALVDSCGVTDFCFLPSPIAVTVEISQEAAPQVQDVSTQGGDGRLLRVVMPAKAPEKPAEATEQLVSVVAELVSYASLLRSDRFLIAWEELFKRGLMSKVFVARPYRELLRNFAPKEHEALSAMNRPFSDRQFTVKTADALRWPETPGPGYDPDASRAAIAARYKRVEERFAYTLERLGRDTSFQETRARLSAKGWKDWHLLQAIANVGLNYRARKSATGGGFPVDQEAVAALASQEERQGADAVPTSELSEEHLELHILTGMGAILTGYGLHLRPGPIAPAAIDRVARVRYRFWDDDVEHSDPFAVAAAVVAANARKQGVGRNERKAKEKWDAKDKKQARKNQKAARKKK